MPGDWTSGRPPPHLKDDDISDSTPKPVCSALIAGYYVDHHASAAHAARRFLRDQADVEDIVHDAFIRMIVNADKTGMADPNDPWPAGKVASYLRQTVTNLCLDRYRATQRRPAMITLDAFPVDVLPAVEQEDRMIKAETAEEVRGALCLLPSPQRDALILREYQEADTDTIASTLNMDAKNVKHLLGRARKGLRARLEAAGYLAAA